MKSLFYLSLVAAGMFAVHANGQSLYTLAGPVGLEESLPLTTMSTPPIITSRNPRSSVRT